MKVQYTTDLIASRPLSQPDDEFVFALPDGGTGTVTGDPDEPTRLFVEISVPVDATTLTAVPNPSWKNADGTQVVQIHLGDGDRDRVLAASYAVPALSFLLQQPLRQQRTGGATIHADSPEEEAALDALGGQTGVWLGPDRGSIAVRTFRVDFNDDHVTRLLAHPSGLLLMQDAANATTDTSRLIAYWRVLESAFGRKGPKLVDCLERYQPVIKMEFDHDKLEALRTLRGRAAHAESRAGLAEIIRVNRECSDWIACVACLAERVLLTKETWGTASLAISEILPLHAYMRGPHEVVYFKRAASEQAADQPSTS